MSKAEELAKRSRRISEILMSNGTVNTLRVIKYCIESETELRRLAKVEAEHEALKKAISDAEPVFWYRPVMNGEMYEGPHHNNSIGGKMMREEKPGEWVPLYTLEGIRTKP